MFEAQDKPLTMPDILPLVPSLKKNEVSMALCYLLKMGYLSRERVGRTGTRGRKEVWQYTFHSARLPKEAA
jgi:hypothetical protein